MNNMSNLIDSVDKLATAKVGDFITVSVVESLTVEQADRFEQAGIDIAATEDGRLVLVDAE